MNEQQALKHINNIKGFYAHLGAFIGTNLFLFMININTSPNDFWFIYPLFGWGIGLIVHGTQVFGTSKAWERQKLQELTQQTPIQTQNTELVERIDTLIKILNDFNWERLDPDLINSVENITKGKNSSNSEQLRNEIEKLEKFVTSPKYDYYDKATKNK